MRIHILQHLKHETAGVILEWAKENNHTVQHTHLFDTAHVLPNIKEFDVLIILGGTMGVYEESQYQWLLAEKQLIRQAIQADKFILGICLGSQLLAEALGSKVYQNPKKEIGFFPIYKTTEGQQDLFLQTIPDVWQVFHWHGDTFELPKGATHLFYSKACEQQGFRKGKLLGLQFHPEVNTSLLLAMIDFEREELVTDAYVQTESDLLKNDITSQNKKYIYQLLDNLVSL